MSELSTSNERRTAWHEATRGRPSTREMSAAERLQWSRDHFDAYFAWQGHWLNSRAGTEFEENGRAVWISNATCYLPVKKAVIVKFLAERGL